ncbi:unnamed protein product [Effrenium voratum]|uniref:Beta-galactosidase n=1 Tax=Effrenium voratum TaxID=2562239 RepID=A0AA36J0P0_9DINO|nr:unnamed protein product [Effrenium voratum]CAJ1414701.1 unnamed protein product [Effrenium voratum]
MPGGEEAGPGAGAAGAGAEEEPGALVPAPGEHPGHLELQPRAAACGRLRCSRGGHGQWHRLPGACGRQQRLPSRHHRGPQRRRCVAGFGDASVPGPLGGDAAPGQADRPSLPRPRPPLADALLQRHGHLAERMAGSRTHHPPHQGAVPRSRQDAGAWLLELIPHWTGDVASLQLHVALYGSLECTGPVLCETTALADGATLLDVPNPKVWSPEAPFLYGLQFQLREGSKVLDEVNSYTALRLVSLKGDTICLNNSPIYLRLVLDQGYYPDGLWTAPDVASLRRDIVLAQTLGFNGARLHQKVFEPLFFKAADELGYLVFAEYPDWNGGQSRRWEVPDQYMEVVRQEWPKLVQDLHNHPCIVAWGLFNEFGPKHGWEHHSGAGGGFWSRYEPKVRDEMISRHVNFVKETW